MKTLQECKDDILTSFMRGHFDHQFDFEVWMDQYGNDIKEAMKEFAQEACKEQREICYTEARIDRDLGGDIYIIEDSIKNAPEPTPS